MQAPRVEVIRRRREDRATIAGGAIWQILHNRHYAKFTKVATRVRDDAARVWSPPNFNSGCNCGNLGRASVATRANRSTSALPSLRQRASATTRSGSSTNTSTGARPSKASSGCPHPMHCLDVGVKLAPKASEGCKRSLCEHRKWLFYNGWAPALIQTVRHALDAGGARPRARTPPRRHGRYRPLSPHGLLLRVPALTPLVRSRGAPLSCFS
jgi:hypothetical protein